MLIIDVTAERQSQKMRSEFFSNASHELKTPVTSILGFAEMLDSGLLSEEDRKIPTRALKLKLGGSPN